MKEADLKRIEELPRSSSCRVIAFDKAEVVPGFIPQTWFLIVSGIKPWATMKVELQPLIYVTQPDYWEIEVVGCLSGIGTPVEVPYSAVLEITHTLGKNGVEVIGANKKLKIKVG
jgi:hypothetical protein